jgi:Anti-sigma-K factor rskA, C-terminal
MDRDDERIAYLAGEPVESLPAADRAELDELRALLSSPEMWEEPDPRLEHDVVAAIEQEAAARPRAPAPRSERRESPLRRILRPPVIGFAAIAAAAAAVVVIAVTTGSNGPVPLHYAMVVEGTPLAPDAHGSATLTKMESGWQIKLSATGLPHLANGRYYQAWLKNAAGILVPVGTFNDALNVTLWSGVPVTQYRTLTVTQQQAGGSPASSGRRVLIGTIRPAG